MNTSNFQQKAATVKFNPKPLTHEMETAIDALLTGKSDREAAEIAGCTRWSVQRWKTSNPLFMATLAQRREALFSGALTRLRSLLTKAIENVAGAVEAGDVKASFELLKATGVYGFMPPTEELDPAVILDHLVSNALAQEQLPDKFDHLMDPLRNPDKERRKAEIREDFLREFGEPDA